MLSRPSPSSLSTRFLSKVSRKGYGGALFKTTTPPRPAARRSGQGPCDSSRARSICPAYEMRRRILKTHHSAPSTDGPHLSSLTFSARCASGRFTLSPTHNPRRLSSARKLTKRHLCRNGRDWPLSLGGSVVYGHSSTGESDTFVPFAVIFPAFLTAKYRRKWPQLLCIRSKLDRWHRLCSVAPRLCLCPAHRASGAQCVRGVSCGCTARHMRAV